MSQNKHTPEPWEYWENDRTGFGVKMPRKKKTRFGAEPYAVIGGFEQEDRAEMKANARRIVACVNACAGCATEVLETAPVGFFNSTYGHPKYLEEITKQRDELLAALEKMNRAYVILMESARDRICDLGGECDGIDVMERNDPYLRESRAAIASVKGSAE